MTADQWVKCSDQLPKAEQFVLAYFKNEYGKDRRIRAFVGHATILIGISELESLADYIAGELADLKPGAVNAPMGTTREPAVSEPSGNPGESCSPLEPSETNNLKCVSAGCTNDCEKGNPYLCAEHARSPLKASERRGTPEEEADWAEFGDCPRCWRCSAPVIAISGSAPGCIRNCPPSPENGGAVTK